MQHELAMAALLRNLSASSETMLSAGILVVRAWFGLLLAFNHGLGKFDDLAGFSAKVADKGIPLAGLLGPAAATSELIGGLLFALGLFSRMAALFMLVTMLVAAFVIHAADPFSKKEFALAYAMAALAVLVAGPGKFSLDARFFGKR
jgi:putative oxidoreductase